MLTGMDNRDRPDQPELAEVQLAQSAVWKLPAELFPSWTHASDNVEPQDVAQRIISDCSVCASIVVCLVHHKRFSSNVSPLRTLSQRYSIMAIVREVVPPPASQHTCGGATNPLPIRCGIPLQWEHTTCESCPTITSVSAYI